MFLASGAGEIAADMELLFEKLLMSRMFAHLDFYLTQGVQFFATYGAWFGLLKCFCRDLC